MTTTWVLVAHRAGARIFAHEGAGRPLALLAEVDHPKGRVRDSEVDSDRQGRAFDSHGTASHGLSRAEEPHEHDARLFAGELAETLRKGRVEGRLDQIVMVAEPGFLGYLRAALDAPTAACVSATLGKDLGRLPSHEMGERLQDLLGSGEASAFRFVG